MLITSSKQAKEFWGHHKICNKVQWYFLVQQIHSLKGPAFFANSNFIHMLELGITFFKKNYYYFCFICSCTVSSLYLTGFSSSCGIQAQLPHGTWDHSSPTRNGTQVSCIEAIFFYHLSHQRTPNSMLNGFQILLPQTTQGFFYQNYLKKKNRN